MASQRKSDQIFGDPVVEQVPGIGWREEVLAVGSIANVRPPSFSRPSNTTPYDVGDIVANSATAGSVVAMALPVARNPGGSLMLRRLKLRKSGTGTANAVFRAHVFRSAPGAIANGDNGAFSVSGSDDYCGAFDIAIDRAFTDGACGFGVPVIGSEICLKLAAGLSAVFVLLEARAAYTPESGETFVLEGDVLQN